MEKNDEERSFLGASPSGGALACFGDDGDVDVRHLVGETAILMEPMVQRHPRTQHHEKHWTPKRSECYVCLFIRVFLNNLFINVFFL